MKTYCQNGLVGDAPYIANEHDKFCVQKLESLSGDQLIYPGDSLKNKIDDELVSLDDKLRDLIFKDRDMYYAGINAIPIFAQSAGQDSDCQISAGTFNKLIHEETFSKIPNIYRYLYLADCQFLVGTIQNLLSGMDGAFTDYYIKICNIGNNIRPFKPNSTMCFISQSVSSISSLLESYFIKAYSILDMLCKLANEFEHPENDFSTYKKIKNADLLWGYRKNLHINGTPKTVFETSDLISAIECLRNEVIHNGSWELNPKIFITFREGTIAERYMLFPDIVNGRLASIKSRRHFFSLDNKVNEILPQIHLKYLNRVLNTAKAINEIDIKE